MQKSFIQLSGVQIPLTDALRILGTSCALWAGLKEHILQYCLSPSSFKLRTHVLLDKQTHLTEQQRLRQQTDPLRHLPAEQNMHMVFFLSTSLPMHRDSFSAQVYHRLPGKIDEKRQLEHYSLPALALEDSTMSSESPREQTPKEALQEDDDWACQHCGQEA